MITDFAYVISSTIGLFKIPFTIYGFELTMWQVLIWCIVAGLVVRFIWEVFTGG